MARNKKVEMLSNEQEALHPMTDGDCVIFANGQTLTQKLSEDDSVKYTPEIVNSSPMFKVGEGNSVDYSDNVLDGAYERATLQGQTYVNYIQESSADEITLPTPFTEYERTQHNTLTSNEEGTLGINLVGQSYVNALQHDSEEEYVVLGESLEFQEKKVEYTNEGQIKSAMLKGQTLVNLVGEKRFYNNNGTIALLNGWEFMLPYNLTKGKTYLAVFNATGTISSTNSKVYLMDNNFNSTTGNTDYGVDFKAGYNMVKCVASGDNHRVLRIRTQVEIEASSDFEVSDVMLFEYQEGMEDWDIPYFEGMQSVTVSTRLENLCHKYYDTQSTNVFKIGKTFTTSDRALYMGDHNTLNPLSMTANTKYLVQFKISNLVLDGLPSVGIVFSDSTVASGNSMFGEDANSTSISENGVYRVVLTTSNIVDTSAIVIKGYASEWEQTNSTLRSLTISEIIYVEYQNGMENWDLPYFEDYQVMKPVQVESVSKNLYDVNKLTNTTTSSVKVTIENSVVKIESIRENGACYWTTLHGDTVLFKKGVTYILSYDYTTSNSDQNITCVDIETQSAFQRISTTNNGGKVITKYCLDKDTEACLRFYVAISSDGKLGGVTTYSNIQIEESDTATEYVAHQSKTTYSWDEVILRKIGDVEDTLDLTTGEWVQRIGEIVLDGSENWSSDTNGAGATRFYNALCTDMLIKHGTVSSKANLICDKFNHPTSNIYTEASDCVQVVLPNGIFFVSTQCSTVEEWRAWLKQNKTKIQYILATPIVHKVNLSRPNLQVYDDITHVHTKCLDGTLVPNIYLPSDISYPAILEPSTTYNVCVNQTEVIEDNPLTVNVGGTSLALTDSRMTITTPATLTTNTVSFTGKDNKIKEAMLIKNSSLLTGNLPHFNGIGSVQLGKTIENLCDSTDSMYGGCVATKTVYNDHVSVTVTKTGSLVVCSSLIRPLENGKKYFVYAPNTFPTANACHVGFYNYYNNTYNFGHQVKSVQTGKCIIEIDQKDKLYTMITLGYHSTLPIGTYTIQRPIICEYEPGMENWDWESIGYFTGTKNIGNEFMRVQNKNLFVKYYDKININNIKNLSIRTDNTVGATRMALKFYNKNLQPILNNNAISCNQQFYHINDSNKWALSSDRTQVLINNISILDSNIAFMTIEKLHDSNIEYVNIQIEESSTTTTYTAHKHNGLYITKDQPIDLTWEQGKAQGNIGESYTVCTNNVLSTQIRPKGLINLKPNTTYRISLGATNYRYHLSSFDNNDCQISSIDVGSHNNWNFTDSYFTTTKDIHKFAINVSKVDNTNITPTESVHAQVRLEEVTDVVLRGVGDVHDELDITRGIYTQRIGEVVLDGSDDEGWYADASTTLNARFKTNIIGTVGSTKTIVDKVVSVEWWEVYGEASGNEILHLSTKVGLHLSVLKTKAQTVDELKLYLKSNPITVQYILNTPIVHQVHIGNKNESNNEVAKPNDVFTLPTLYTEQTHIDLTNNGVMPKVQSRDYIAYPVSPMINRTYTLIHNNVGSNDLTIDLLGRTQTLPYSTHKGLVYTPTTMDAILHNELRISGANNKISRIMYIDGGYMDRDIPYIEGMKNAVNPIVKNYTDTQENICYADCGDETIYLRSLPNGVCDEIDLETGKYIQRVGEITFNGTESWSVGYPSWDNKCTYYNNGFVDIKTMKGDDGSGAYYDAVRCPQLHRSYMNRLASVAIDGICSYYYSGHQRIFISKQDCATVDELKLWLQENPITVQYELPEPIVKDIVIHNYPHSYEGGHVIIENGDPNTPIPAQLTYRAVTNRSGQIQQHTEQVEKQDREINELEMLILGNIHLSQTR